MSTEPVPPRSRSLLVRLAIAITPLLLLLVLTEIVLTVLGLGGGDALNLGFDPETAVIVPDPDVPGGYQTRLFIDSAVEELVIPPKGAARRVLLLGGSNTQLMPGYALQEQLTALDPSSEWEVINLGRAGYGSTRVAILAQHSLLLQPDLVLVYSGHNEFVEAEFEREVEEHSTAVTSALTSVMEKLRSYRLVLGALKGPETGDPVMAMGPMQRETGPWKGTSWTETQFYMSVYRANIERIHEVLSEAGVPVVLSTLVSHTLMPPRIATLPEGVDETVRQEYEAAMLEAQRLVGQELLSLSSEVNWLRVGEWYSNPVDLGRDVPTMRPLTKLLHPAPAWPMRDEPARNGRPSHRDSQAYSVEGHHWPRSRGWTEAVYDELERVDALLRRELDAESRARIEEALPLLRRANALIPEQPDALFRLGMVLWHLGGNDTEAVSLLWHGAARDRAPRRATMTSNDVLRSIAAEHDDIAFYDAARAFREASPNGIVSYEVMMDKCHLQPGARIVFLEQIAKEIVEVFADG